MKREHKIAKQRNNGTSCIKNHTIQPNSNPNNIRLTRLLNCLGVKERSLVEKLPMKTICRIGEIHWDSHTRNSLADTIPCFLELKESNGPKSVVNYSNLCTTETPKALWLAFKDGSLIYPSLTDAPGKANI